VNHLVYLSYGQGPHVDETRFAILSAVHHDGPSPAGYQTVVITDNPAAYADFPVSTDLLTPEQIRDWPGPTGYIHRIKILALQQLMQRRPGKAVMVDGDTYFRRSPTALFERVAPGRSVMHVREGTIGHLVALGHIRQQLVQVKNNLGPAGRYDFAAGTAMWNSGVIGIDPADAGLFTDVIALNDSIRQQVPVKIAEQLAFNRVLERHTHLAESRDIVFHYHQDFMRDRFRQRLPGLMRQTASLPAVERAAALWSQRPLPPRGKQIKAAIKRPLKRFGLFQHDLETSV
jgi:hypothetical protein